VKIIFMLDIQFNLSRKIEKNKIDKLNNEIKLEYEYKIKNLELENKLNIINNKIELYEINKLNIENNILIQEKLDKTNKELKELNKILIEKKIMLSNLEKDYKLYIKKSEEYNNLILKQRELKTRIDMYNDLIKLMKPDGMPLKLIQSNLKIIETNINNMLIKILNKTIKIKDDTKNIHIMICNNNKACNFFGGFEYFVVSLVFKIYFSSFLNLSTCGLLVIDEGVSVFSNNSIQKFGTIADFIKQYYEYIILITHISAFDDFVSTKIEIKKTNDTSKITFE